MNSFEKFAITLLVLFCLLVAAVMSPILLAPFGLKPWDIPGTYTVEKRVIADINDNLAPLPSGFTHSENPRFLGGISVHVEGNGNFSDSAKAHRALVDAVGKADPYGDVHIQTVSERADSKIVIQGSNVENIEALTTLADNLAGPAGMVLIELDERSVSVYAGEISLVDDERAYAGPCAASRAEYVANLPEIASATDAGFSVDGFFTYCTDTETPGATFVEVAYTKEIAELDRLLNGALGDTVERVGLFDNGTLTITLKPGQESAESQWREKWKYGEVKVM